MSSWVIYRFDLKRKLSKSKVPASNNDESFNISQEDWQQWRELRTRRLNLQTKI